MGPQALVLLVGAASLPRALFGGGGCAWQISLAQHSTAPRTHTASLTAHPTPEHLLLGSKQLPTPHSGRLAQGGQVEEDTQAFQLPTGPVS